jgi:RNA polymerase sigma-70 factor (ECF subfamily)
MDLKIEMKDSFLIWRFKCGSSDALCSIYEKYEDYMLTIATSLLNDVGAAEDIVHDVFVSFAQSAEKIWPGGNLKGYFTTCVVNLARDRIRARQRQAKRLDKAESVSLDSNSTLESLISDEQLHRLTVALAQLPYEQREVITLHLQGRFKFKAIAELQNVSINTVQSRYSYGLDKLRSLFDSEVEK